MPRKDSSKDEEGSDKRTSRLLDGKVQKGHMLRDKGLLSKKEDSSDEEGPSKNATAKEQSKPKERVEEKRPRHRAKAKDQKEVFLSLRALTKIIRQGLRFSNPSIPSSSWIECMGFLLGDVTDDQVDIKDAVPITHGSKVEVNFDEEHYMIADEINSSLSNDLWVVGWYHTHPGHGLFLSDIDKVNHAGYQTLNPDAIAVVFDPSKMGSKKTALDEYLGVFRLDDPERLERSKFIEIEEIKVNPGYPEVLQPIYEIGLLVSNGGDLLMEYKEKLPEDGKKARTAGDVDIDELSADLKRLRSVVEDTHDLQKELNKRFITSMAELIDDEALE